MPAAWDRLADVTKASPALQLSIVALGHVHAADLEPLTKHFARLEQLVLDIAPRDPVSSHRAELNRAVDAATNDWILILREREVIDEPLAAGIARAVASPSVRAYRIASVPSYAGKPLAIGRTLEVRLFHRRYYLRFADKGEWSEIQVQGTVMRLSEAFRSVTFGSIEEHESELGRLARRRTLPARLVRFAGAAVAARTSDSQTLRYLWTEAGWQR